MEPTNRNAAPSDILQPAPRPAAPAVPAVEPPPAPAPPPAPPPAVPLPPPVSPPPPVPVLVPVPPPATPTRAPVPLPAAPAAPPTPPAPLPSYNESTVKSLKAYLRNANLRLGGNKRALYNRALESLTATSLINPVAASSTPASPLSQVATSTTPASLNSDQLAGRDLEVPLPHLPPPPVSAHEPEGGYEPEPEEHDDGPEPPAEYDVDPAPARPSPAAAAPPIRYSPQQQSVLARALPPSAPRAGILRITAAAGTGKTTTLLGLAGACAARGHASIVYLTFARAAAEDGAARIRAVLGEHGAGVTAGTLHAWAMRLLRESRGETGAVTLWDEARLGRFVGERCAAAVEAFLVPLREYARLEMFPRVTDAATKQRKVRGCVDAAAQQVRFFLGKTLDNFCRSSMDLDRLRDKRNPKRHYYPATKFHGPDGDGEKQGFVHAIYSDRLGFYADQVVALWDAIVEEGVTTYNTDMKQAQLARLALPGTLLLCDECQDMDGCQVDWIDGQRERGAHVVLVGDPAQTIYGFRGAKSTFMLGCEGEDCRLTQSWRFGRQIARAANTVLLAKERSPQTTKKSGKYRLWVPYRIEGAGGEGGVTAGSLIDRWKEGPFTLISYKNATLFLEIMKLLGVTPPEHSKKEEGPETSPAATLLRAARCTSPLNERSTPHVISPSPPSPQTAPHRRLPKIHINGKGEGSGAAKWATAFREVESLYGLYTNGEGGTALDEKKFPDFQGQAVTWKGFCEHVQRRELGRYVAAKNVVEIFREKTMEAVDIFRTEVMERKYGAGEADVVLSTVHSAKGMEWDHVMVCDDMVDLNKIDEKGPAVRVLRGGEEVRRSRSWQFALSDHNDAINILYVAVTRARKLLSVPASMVTFWGHCDALHEAVRRGGLYHRIDGEVTASFFALEHPLTAEQAVALYEDIVLPLRRELSLGVRGSARRALCNADGDADEGVSLSGDADLEAFFRPAGGTGGCDDGGVTAMSASRHEKRASPQKENRGNDDGKGVDDDDIFDSMDVDAMIASHHEKMSSQQKKDCDDDDDDNLFASMDVDAMIAAHKEKSPPKKKPCAVSAMWEESRHKKAAVGGCPGGFPPDRCEDAPTNKHGKVAHCRHCHTPIDAGSSRIGFPMQQTRGEWWLYFFHAGCVPDRIASCLDLGPIVALWHRSRDEKGRLRGCPKDTREMASREARCRQCQKPISPGTNRVGFPIYQQHKNEWWPSYFHERCVPSHILSSLDLGSSPKKRKKNSSSSKRSRGSPFSKFGGFGRKNWRPY